MVIMTTKMVVDTMRGPIAPGTSHARATAIAPRSPDHHITVCSAEVIFSVSRCPFTRIASGKMLSARPMRIMMIVHTTRAGSSSSIYTTTAKPTRRKTVVSATVAITFSSLSTCLRAGGDRLGAAKRRMARPQKREDTMPDKCGTSAPTNEMYENVQNRLISTEGTRPSRPSPSILSNKAPSSATPMPKRIDPKAVTTNEAATAGRWMPGENSVKTP
mmetsp:Transcript_2702/g.6554  ORF Transcript_2702/g.6554 Transcript_2702/m.6554 type:complete len:217 (-) Transcript_2702:1043-1693(-)